MTVRVKDKMPIVVPPSVRRRAGLKTGDRIEFRVSGRVITIVPQPTGADDEYTPEQRRVIDAGIAKGLEELKKGAFTGRLLRPRRPLPICVCTPSDARRRHR